MNMKVERYYIAEMSLIGVVLPCEGRVTVEKLVFQADRIAEEPGFQLRSVTIQHTDHYITLTPLTSSASKLITKIIYKRVENKVENQQDADQLCYIKK